MRLIAGAAGLAILALGLALWAMGAFDAASWWAAKAQREFQNAMAGAISALKRGDGAALWALIGVSAGYGFAHAVGPGHGKVLIGGAALATRASAWRMAGLAVASSLAQSASAVLLVYGGLLVVEVSASWAVGTVEGVLAPASYAAIGMIGLVLVWRGARALARLGRAAAHRHEDACCGHAHGPTPEQAERLSCWRDTALLIGSIAIRPCTGAVFLLIIAWGAGLVWQGFLAVIAMGLGTAAFTVIVALSGVAARGSALFASGGNARTAALALPLLQVLAGAAIVMFAAAFLMASPALG